MQALIQIIVGFVALLAAAALSQFGLQLDAREKPQREVHRVRDCDSDKTAAAVFAAADRQQDC